jgi:lycopene beta-cyclase
MPVEKNFYDYIVCGGGASGLLLLYRMAQDPYFASKKILLIEKEAQKANDRTWCFWETSPGPLEQIVAHRWSKAHFKHPDWSQLLTLSPFDYKMIRGEDFYRFIHQALTHFSALNIVYAPVEKIQDAGALTTVKTTKDEFQSPKVFSSIHDPQRYLQQHKYPVLQQHFLGWVITSEQEAFSPDEIVFMDFDLPQEGRTQFIYLLPFSKNKALIEFTLFSPDLLSTAAYEKGIKDYLQKVGIEKYTIEEKENGCIPMTAYNFDRHNTKTLLHIGTAGGWTKASTGYTFQKTIKKTAELIDFIKKERPLNDFKTRNKYHFYDTLFIDVLAQYNEKGGALFKNLFQQNKHLTIFKFLDEEASLWDDLKIMRSFPLLVFVKALFKRLF